MGQLFGLLTARVLGRGQPTIHELAEGLKALADLEARATVGKLALRPSRP
jgi:NADPH2:quinone reductase